jgi:hypothetical protein
MHPHVPDLTHHHRTLAAAVAAFALAVLAVAVPARLADRTLTFSGASSAAPAAPAAPAPAVRPAWIDRPLASPLGSLVSAGSRPAPSSG